MKNQNKPWLDQTGKPFSTELLNEVSGNWTEETWGNYLQTIEKPIKEKLIEPRLYDDLAARQDEPIFQKFCITPDPNSQRLVQNLLSHLSFKQRYVLEQTFFEGRTEREIARQLGLSQPTVHLHKKEALNRINQQIEMRAINLPLIWEHVLNPKDPFQKIDECYLEGSLTKDERDHLWALAELGGMKEGDLS